MATTAEQGRVSCGRTERVSEFANVVAEITGHKRRVDDVTYPNLGVMMDNERERLRCVQRSFQRPGRVVFELLSHKSCPK